MSRLLNVRLSEEDHAKVRALRAEGVELSKFVRSAIRAEFERRSGRGKGRGNARERLAQIHARHPLPADAPFHGIDTADRRAVSRFIEDRLRRRGR